MGWNGLDLVNDFSAELGDTSSSFKTKVLRWINEGIRDIATSHNWPFLREKGKVVLKASQESQFLPLEKPSAPTVAALAGGSLALTYQYRFLITFFESASQVESIAGEPSEGIIPVGADLSVLLSDLPFSSNPLVTDRYVYVSKAGGLFQFYGKIGNNLEEIPAVLDGDGVEITPAQPITFEVTSDSLSQITPPEENAIFMIDGELIIDNSGIVHGTSLQDLEQQNNGSLSTGTPNLWAPVNEEEIRTYPIPSKNYTATFYYFKIPQKVYGISSSIPQLPVWLYEDVRRYVIWRGFEYRDRAGKESKQANYENGLRLTISRKGKPIKRSGRVRSVTSDSDGYGV